MKDCLLTYTIFASILFFSITSILGSTYSGGETDNSYLYASLFSFIYSVSVTTFYFIRHGNTVRKLPFVITIIALILVAAYYEGYMNSVPVRIFIAFAIPDILVGTYYGSQCGLRHIAKWIDIVMLIVTLGLILSLDEFLRAMYVGEVGYSQDKSYFACLAFLLNIFMLQFGDNFDRFKFTSSKYYLYLCSVLLPIQVVLLLISGGRGGFVALVVGICVFIYCARKHRTHSIKRLFLIIGGALLAGVIIGSLLSSHFVEILDNSISRVFSYVSSSGIDLTQTSHRDEVYEVAWKNIIDNPILGYGFFSYRKVMGEWPYPHNLFLEWLLQGGVFFFLLLFVFLCKQIKKMFKNIEEDPSLLILVPLLFYCLSELMFSATYICLSLFWFCVAYLYSYKTSH